MPPKRMRESNNNPNACHKFIADNPKIGGIKQFHNNITAALNAAATANPHNSFKKCFFIIFYFYLFLIHLSIYTDKRE
jgi:hypothetical protein